MAEKKFDFKKEYPGLYLPGDAPALIDVPEMSFLMVDGKGDPGGPEYVASLQAIYALAYTIKMAKMNTAPEGYFEYVVPPPEGLWWGAHGFDIHDRNSWRWTTMVRQPGFVTQDVFGWALAECGKKKPEVDVSNVRLERFTEGLCVQAMHTGPFSDEPATIEKMKRFINSNGFKDVVGDVRKHHEIYLSDPRKTAPEKLKTILRLPVERIG